MCTIKIVEQPKDTPRDAAAKVTYEPTLATFEMDIMKAMDIKEERTAAPVYWY